MIVKNQYPICEFDTNKNPIIHPTSFLTESLPKKCIITYLRKELERFVEENKLPTSYWYMLEHAYGASGNFKNRERLKTRAGKVVKKWSDDRFKYLTLEFDE